MWVCKSWRSLISTPSFITSHLNHSTTTFNLILLRHYSHHKERFSLHFNNQTFPKFLDLKCPSSTRFKYYFRIIGSCNGLLCLTDDCFGYTNTIILWNPPIHRSLTLRVPRVTSESTSPFMCVHGFGLDLIKNDFKVVRISYLGSENGFKVPPQVKIYALGDRSWRDFDGVVPRFGMVNYFWSQAYLNGKVHWVSYKLIDPVTCVFGEIELPVSLVHQFPRNMLTAIVGELLSVLQYDSPIYNKSCTVWVIKEYGVVGSWSKQYTIDLDGRLVLTLGLRKNSEILLGMGRELVLYDSESQEITNLGVRGSKDAF
ncbi:F-box/kelch-repeat protein [Camellia lanceoleosa]|nr:F-box/kelch-repeat protein [Camellia lanceoleosa]